jgi:hypothetical protein
MRPPSSVWTWCIAVLSSLVALPILTGIVTSPQLTVPDHIERGTPISVLLICVVKLSVSSQS